MKVLAGRCLGHEEMAGFIYHLGSPWLTSYTQRAVPLKQRGVHITAVASHHPGALPLGDPLGAPCVARYSCGRRPTGNASQSRHLALPVFSRQGGLEGGCALFPRILEWGQPHSCQVLGVGVPAHGWGASGARCCLARRRRTLQEETGQGKGVKCASG